MRHVLPVLWRIRRRVGTHPLQLIAPEEQRDVGLAGKSPRQMAADVVLEVDGERGLGPEDELRTAADGYSRQRQIAADDQVLERRIPLFILRDVALHDPNAQGLSGPDVRVPCPIRQRPHTPQATINPATITATNTHRPSIRSTIRRAVADDARTSNRDKP